MIKAQSLLSIRTTRSFLEKQTCLSPTSEYARTALSPRQKIEAQHDLEHLNRKSLDLKAAERKIWWDEQRYVKSLAARTAKDHERQEIEYRAEQRRKAIAYDRQIDQLRKVEEHERKLRAVQAVKTHKSAVKEEDTVKSKDDFQRTVSAIQRTKSQLMVKAQEDTRSRHHAELQENLEMLQDKVTARRRYRKMESSVEEVERDYAQAKTFEEKLTEQERRLALVKSELKTAELATRARKSRQ